AEAFYAGFLGQPGGPTNQFWELTVASPPGPSPSLQVRPSVSSAAATWVQVNPSGPQPPARFNHTAVWDPVGNRMIIFGGASAAPLGDLWSYSPTGNTWTQLTPAGPAPSARF